MEIGDEDGVKACKPRSSLHQAQLILTSWSWLADELSSWLFSNLSQTLILIFHGCMDHGVWWHLIHHKGKIKALCMTNLKKSLSMSLSCFSMDSCKDVGISLQEWKARCTQPLIKDPSLSWLSTLELNSFCSISSLSPKWFMGRNRTQITRCTS
jgi:hypothetical protein